MTVADTVIVNARVHTMDRALPEATCLAIADGRLIAVGDRDAVDPLIGADTTVRDLEGAAVLPGLIDVHNHHMMAGEADLQFVVSPTASFDELLDALRAYAQDLAPDAWIIGESFGSTLLEDFSRVEARHAVDDASGGRPVALSDDSHHNRFANTRALELAGITADSTDPHQGTIVRDAGTGEPSGLLLETATLALTRAVNASVRRGPENYRAASAHAIGILNSLGITAFQDAAATVDIMGALRDLDHGGNLHAWVSSCMLSGEFLFADTPWGKDLVEQGEQFRTLHHRPDFVKVALDGVPPTYTGAFLTPYLPSPEHGHAHCGTTIMAPEELGDWLLWTAERGLGAKIHCTGDAAVRVALDAIEQSRRAGNSVIYQIAHGQFVHPDDRRRFADLDVAADISPYLWFPGVIPDAISHVRPADEAQQMQPNRDLIDLGVVVAGGSDWPVSVSPNPWEGIQGLVTREDPLGRAPGALWPEQAITLHEALEAFTVNSAIAMGLDSEIGSLRVGKSADLVILNQDPFAVDVTELIGTHAVETWFCGAPVFVKS